MVSLDILEYMVNRYEVYGDESFYSVRKLCQAFPNVCPRAIQKAVKKLHGQNELNSQAYILLNTDQYLSSGVRTYKINLGCLRKIKNLLKEHIAFKLRVAETRRLLDSNRDSTALKS